MVRSKYYLVLLITFFSLELSGQSFFSHDTTNGFIVVDFDSIGVEHNLSSIDTSLDRLIDYHQIGWSNSLLLGNYGAASNPFVRPHSNTGVWLYGATVNENYIYSPENDIYYQVKVPFSEIVYFNGPREEQEIRFIHSQNINDRLNIGVRFRRFSSGGFYQGQRNRQSNASVNFNYVSKDGRYKALGYGMINISESEENGGLIFDSTFTENTEPNRLGVATNLSLARNEYDRRFYGIKNSYGFGDNYGTKGLNRTEVYFKNEFELNDLRYLDESPDSAYYGQFRISNLPSSMSDKYQHRALRNELGFLYRFSKSTYLKTSLNFNWNKLFHTASDTTVYEYRPNAVFRTAVAGWSVNLNGQFTIGGYGEGSYSFSGGASRRILEYYRFNLHGELSSLPSFWEFQYYENEVEYWRNKGEYINTSIFGLSLEDTRNKEIYVKGNLTSIDNYTYFDNTAQPSQYGGSVTYTEIQAGYLLSILDPFFIEIDGTYRAKFDDDAPINLPALQSVINIYAERPFFKRALKGQLGVMVHHMTSFTADGYLPLGRRFYYQDEIETGGFIYADAYLSLNIGAVSGFVKFSNITQGITDYNYIIVPHYPLPDGGLRFGISWRMNN